MANIRLTLLKCLFFEDPPFFGDLIAENQNHVFPGREDFILFLEESDSQKRTKLAKRLLSRLARESGIFVPFGLLLSLLRAEEQYAPSTATAQYVPQDHFSHLVQLYLLGIYVFTHHKRLHRSITSHFKHKREAVTHSCSVSSEETAFFDFLFAWRSFVLLHDIGYPCELPKVSNNSLLEKIRNSYIDIREMVSEETTLAFLSRLISWQLLDEQFPQTTCESVAPGLFRDDMVGMSSTGLLPGMAEALRIPNVKNWRSAERVAFLHGRRFASLSAHIRSSDKLLAILVHRRTGAPSLALIPDDKGGHVLINMEGKVRLSLHELRRHAFELGTTPRVGTRHAEYEWQMFLANSPDGKNQFLRVIQEVINRYYSPDLLGSVSDSLAVNAPDPLRTITSESDFLAYEHWVYENLQNWLQGIRTDPAPTGGFEHGVVTSHAKSMEREISEHIANVIKRKVDESVNTIIRRDGGILTVGIEAIVKKALPPVLQSKVLCGEVVEFVHGKLHDRIESEIAKHRLFGDVKTLSDMVYSKVNPVGDGGVGKDCDLVETLIAGLNVASSHVKSVNLLFSESGLPGLIDLMHQYRPAFIEKGSLDHGLASAVCSLHVTRFADDLLAACRRGKATSVDCAVGAFSAISVCLGDEIEIEDLDYRASTLMPEVTRAVAIHNIYPKYLDVSKKTSFRVNLRREPFCFFAMLCDVLQCWDRDRRIWQSEGQLQHKTNGDRYDINIEGDVIHVREHDHGVDVAKRADALKAGLEGYLEGVKDYIWLDLAQWPDEEQQPSRVFRSGRARKMASDSRL